MKPQDNENKQAVDNEPCRANKAWLLNNSKHEHVDVNGASKDLYYHKNATSYYEVENSYRD